ncbi:recombination regulator RecX [Sporosarcina ureae]|uniref:recombination regulator RecX n=1 Tax=Sporosarcina ureae TaxID=1571 RepID=UPI0026EED7F1|nr:recombination regulator RecX [Sporosarcina ureae]
MPLITKISQQKRDSERYNIFLDDQYAFSVHETVLVKFELTKGMELDDWSTDEIVYSDQIEKAFNRALHFLSFRMRSEMEVKKKLLEKEYGEAVVLEAIVKLKRLGFLNDEAFSEALVRTEKNSTLKGPRAIQQSLYKKGIPKELQTQALEEYTMEDQMANAMKLAEKTMRSNSSQPPAQVKQKIQNTLARKGFSYQQISEVLSNLTIERDEEEWSDITSAFGEKAWRRYQSKYSGSDLRQRVKQSMYQKGIPLGQIDQFIEQKRNEEDGY